MQKQSLITLFAAVWSCAAIGAAHASTHPASSSTGPIAAKKGAAAKAGHKGKRRAIARNRKGSTQADLDPDAEVLAQVLSSDNRIRFGAVARISDQSGKGDRNEKHVRGIAPGLTFRMRGTRLQRFRIKSSRNLWGTGSCASSPCAYTSRYCIS